MDPVAAAQALATVVPPPAAGALVVFAGAAAVLAGSLRSGSREGPLAAAFVASGTASLWPFAPDAFPGVHAAVLGASAVALVLLLLRRPAADAAPEPEAAPRALAAGAAFGFALLLLSDLGGYAGTLLTWESPVSAGFIDAFRRGVSPVRYLLERFRWDDGLVSGGETSLFYGAPTYALLSIAGFSTVTLRAVAAVAALASLVLLGGVARRFFGPAAAAGAVVAFAVSPAALFYGRYGTSLSATILAVLVALAAVWAFVASPRPSWWAGPACGLALFLATLNYSPARIVVLVLLVWLFAALALRGRRLNPRQLAGGFLIAVVAACVWHLEGRLHGRASFLEARGEHLFRFFEEPRSVEPLFGRDLLGRGERLGPLDRREKLTLTIEVLRTTLPQYAERIAPWPSPPRRGTILAVDPPPVPLYYGPFAAFLAWGIGLSVRSLRSGPHACLLAWLVLGSLPLLLTNRVDAHRAVLLTIPFSLWIGLGLREAGRIAREAGVGAPLRRALAAALALAAAWNLVDLLYDPAAWPPAQAASLARGLRATDEPVVVGALWSHRDLGWLRLQAAEQSRRSGAPAVKILDPAIREAIHDGAATTRLPSELLHLLESTTLVLAPADAFERVARLLRARGLSVERLRSGSLRYLRVRSVSAASRQRSRTTSAAIRSASG